MISYIGGKYRMAKWIYEYIPQDIETYMEVFGGRFWTYLRSDVYKIPTLKKVYYNDFNKLMVNMFACRRYTNEFYEHFKNIPSQDEQLFNKFKDEILNLDNNDNIKNIKIPDFDLGYKYPYLLTQVFSGTGIKKNTKMQDLKGKYKSKFDSFRNRLIQADYEMRLDKITDTFNLDFEEAIKKVDNKNTFIYLDPPYYNTEDYYSFHNFTREDHLRVANTIKNMQGIWALSYYEFEELEEWFPKDKYIWVEKDFAKAASAKKGIKQNKGKEILIMNYTLDENKKFSKII